MNSDLRGVFRFCQLQCGSDRQIAHTFSHFSYPKAQRIGFSAVPTIKCGTQMIAEINDNLYAESLDAKTDRRCAQFACPALILYSRNEKRIASLNSLAWRFRIHPFPEKNRLLYFLKGNDLFRQPCGLPPSPKGEGFPLL